MSRRIDPICRAGIPMPAEQAQPASWHGRRHLRRLDRIFEHLPGPIYYITCCVHNREPILNDPRVVSALVEAWTRSPDLYRWLVGRYVVMPDHVHFFTATCREDAKSLSGFMSCWKRWTKRAVRKLGVIHFDWQAEFFDHVLRSAESYEGKWEYVRCNPVRAELVASPEEWPFQGELNILQW
jgi:REP element-mobilizing transposase RayT